MQKLVDPIFLHIVLNLYLLFLSWFLLCTTHHLRAEVLFKVLCGAGHQSSRLARFKFKLNY